MRIVKATFTDSILSPVYRPYHLGDSYPVIDIISVIPINDMDDTEELSFDFVKEHVMGYGYFDIGYVVHDNLTLNINNKAYEYYIDLDFEFKDSTLRDKYLIDKIKIFLRDNKLESILS